MPGILRHFPLICTTLLLVAAPDLSACGMCSSLGFRNSSLHEIGSGAGDGGSAGLAPGGSTTAGLGSFGIAIAAGAELFNNTAALAAFQRAADTWASFISDPIQITIQANLADLGNPNTIGSASSVLLQGGFNLIRGAMVADDPGDPLLQALPLLNGFNATLPPGITLGGDLLLTKANAKALGFTGLDNAFGISDATITFNSKFIFDYDRSDGVAAGAIDFESVALHEIGHALGFISSVDDVDFAKQNNLTGTLSPMVFDLFRFSNGDAFDPSNLSQFTSFPRFLDSGGSAVFDTIDTEWALSTGAFTGDGRQASHWVDGPPSIQSIGAMDPTLAFGQVFGPTAADLRVLDLIGYNVIPEPSSVSVLLSMLILALFHRRRHGQSD
ncbi:MAG: NF038122 family metalloprotease [Verrucomicrobiales bacterium]